MQSITHAESNWPALCRRLDLDPASTIDQVLAAATSDHRVVLAVQRQVAGLVAEKQAQAEQIAGLVAELDCVRHSAHMPDDYQYGLPSWVMKIWISWQNLMDRDGRPIRRTEDIEKIVRLQNQIAELKDEVERLTPKPPHYDPPVVFVAPPGQKPLRAYWDEEA